ncbi:MAG TPA: isoprenylcysteine carboxylmethyltransferase family protein [Bryobacteraceae bacterium]|nr:isoprenylcysteine carboxylmethyltransferase family protein [Bryobacteraceae bacterium]
MRTSGPQAVVVAPVARWGILLEGLGFFLVWSFPAARWSGALITGPSWRGPWPAPFLALSMVLGPAAVLLAWSALRHLGKQWRIQAGLSADHVLVKTGPYRFVRHPVYASMLLMLLATAFAISWWPILFPALALFVAGTEIRIRAEDGLLASRFQEEFRDYRSRVAAYIPFLR